VVVGGGVIGLTTALALVDCGHRVTVVEAGEPGMESSWAGGGIVSPVPPWRYPERINQLVERSRQLFPALSQRLQALSGVDIEYLHSGLLLTGSLPEEGRTWLLQQAARGVMAVEWGQAADFEPALAKLTEPVALLPAVTQVRNSRLVQALAIALQQLGVGIQYFPVAKLDISASGRVIGVIGTEGHQLKADQVVLAAGAWADHVLRRSGLSEIGLRPVRGQMLLFKQAAGMLKRIVNTGEGYLIPRADGHILVGSTVEEVGFDRRPSREAYDHLLAMAQRHVPALGEAAVVCHWAGLRPGATRPLPVLGPSQEVDGLWLNLAHFRNGVGMAPACAELMAAMMQGQPPEPALQSSPKANPNRCNKLENKL